MSDDNGGARFSPQAQREALDRERVNQLETRVDGVFETIGEFRAEVGQKFGEITAAIGELTGEVKGLSKIVETTGKRDQAEFEAKIDLEVAAKKAEVAVEAAAMEGAITTVNVKRLRFVQILKITAATVGLIGALIAFTTLLLNTKRC